MNTSFHIHFNGECQEAFEFYCDTLGAQPGTMLTFENSPAIRTVPDAWRGKIVHANININGVEIAGDDVLPEQYEVPRGFYIILQIETEAKTTELFNLLSENGNIIMPLQETFWSPCYGIVTDRFGVSWKLNCIE